MHACAPFAIGVGRRRRPSPPTCVFPLTCVHELGRGSGCGDCQHQRSRQEGLPQAQEDHVDRLSRAAGDAECQADRCVPTDVCCVGQTQQNGPGGIKSIKA